MVTIRKVSCPENQIKIKCPYSMTPTRIVIHNTANDASANNEIAYMHRNSYETSFHFAVDDTEAVQGIELNRNAWHASDGGNGKGNREGIAIEICYSKSGGPRWEKAKDNGAQLTAYLLHQYGWGIDKVTKHQDYTNKYCPHRLLDEGWQKFLNLVQKYLDEYKKVTYTLVVNVKGYNTAADAKAHTNEKTTVKKGTYYMFYKYPTGYNGMYNLTTNPNTPGSWINPNDNVEVITPKTYGVGDTVTFTGNKHYVSANTSVGFSAKPGKAKITKIHELGKSKHPYHLINISGGGSTVHGWVDASDIK